MFSVPTYRFITIRVQQFRTDFYIIIYLFYKL